MLPKTDRKTGAAKYDYKIWGDKMKKGIRLLLILACLLGLTACGRADGVDEQRIFQVNYINNEETKVITQKYILKADLSDWQAKVEELLEALAATPEKLEYKPPLAQGFRVLDFELQDGKLTLNLDEKYKELSVPQEVLTRAALVRTLTQLEEVQYVAITVEGQPLMDSLGGPLGLMNADTFVDNEGSQINSMEQTRIRLYFTDETGTRLVAVNRTLVYNSNISIEKLVMEQLVAGPTEMSKDVYPTLNPDTKVLGVTINDGTCYVNLDETFLTQLSNATAEVVIYSIANSMAELSNVNKVQISVNGKTDILYRETISLNTVFERDLDLVVNPN